MPAAGNIAQFVVHWRAKGGGFLARLSSGGDREVASSVPAVPLWRQFESFRNASSTPFPIQLCGQCPQNVWGGGRRRAYPSPHFLHVEGASFRSEPKEHFASLPTCLVGWPLPSSRCMTSPRLVDGRVEKHCCCIVRFDLVCLLFLYCYRVLLSLTDITIIYRQCA